MFWNIYGKRIRFSLRNWETLLWTWVFPIMMATLFYFAFSGLDAADRLDTIPTAVVTNQEYNDDVRFHTALQAVSSGESPLLSLTEYGTEEEAKKALENQDIDGYMILENGTPRLAVATGGISQTILKSFLDQYIQGDFSMQTFTKEISLSKNAPSQTVGYFYALLAMVCMYGGFQGLESVSYLQANLSPLGARRTIAPSRRSAIIIFDLLGAFTVHFICLLFLLFYVVFILHVDFGPNLLPVILTCGIGSLLGISFGALITAATRLKEGVKIAIIISVSLMCSYGAGLMVTGINYTIARNLPVLAWINPAARISDAFYCLYYYDGYGRFFLNILILTVMTLVMLAITTLFLRRQRYENI